MLAMAEGTSFFKSASDDNAVARSNREARDARIKTWPLHGAGLPR
jgi:hypothetical protein